MKIVIRVSCIYLMTLYTYIYRYQKTTSNSTKAFVHILVNYFSCALTRVA